MLASVVVAAEGTAPDDLLVMESIANVSSPALDFA